LGACRSPSLIRRSAPDTGDYFKADWFRTYTSEPPRQTLNIYGGSDYAVTSDGGDYTVHVVIGVDAENRMYLLDLWRGQTSSDIWIEAWCDLVKKWRPSFWAEEHGQIISGVGPFLERRAIERHAYTHREQFPSRGDKAVRAQSMRGRMAMLGLYVRQGAPWFADLRAELLSFPAGKHDDQVDALGLVGQLLDKINAGIVRRSRKYRAIIGRRCEAYAPLTPDIMVWLEVRVLSGLVR
jgi:predicted phage terminase large subunit-like protein